MIDPRLDRGRQDERARADAIAILDSTASSLEAGLIISSAFRQILESGAPFDQANFFSSEGIPAVARELRGRGLADWASALEEECETAPRSISIGLSPVQILVGRAAGAFCGESPGEREFAFVRNLRETMPFRSADFLPAARDHLRASDDGQAALRSMLQQRAQDFLINPGAVAHISARDFPHLMAKRPEMLRFADVWDDPFRRTLIRLRDGDAYELLRLTDSKAYLDLLEDFPLREAVHELIDIANGSASASELCLLFKQARPVFDEDGLWIKENQLAFLILNLLGERLLRQASAGAEPMPEFRATLVEIVDALVSRSDKTFLGYAWFERLLMSRGSSHRRGVISEAGSVDNALLYVAAKLSPQLPKHPSPLQWVAAQEYVWRNGRIYALLAIEISRQSPEPAAIISLVEQVMRGDLVSSVGIERLIGGSSVERIVISKTFALIPSPAIWFRGLWDCLFWLRDRARNHRHVGDTPANVGQVVTLWAACALDLLNPASDDARALWIELERAVRESSLTDFFRQSSDVSSLTVRFLGGVWRRTFPEDPMAGTPGSLDDFVAPWIGVNADCGHLAVILRRYDVQPVRLRRAGFTGDLLRLIIDDATAGRRSILGTEETASFRILADELDGCLVE